MGTGIARRGGVKTYKGRLYARARYGGGRRLEERVPWATSAQDVEVRAEVIAELADRLLAAGLASRVKDIARAAARATSSEELQSVCAEVDRYVWLARVNVRDLKPIDVPVCGGVYFVRVMGPRDVAIKIGYAVDSIPSRVSGLRTANPWPLDVLACRPGADHLVERALHGRFAAFRIQGEWFRAELEVIGEIMRARGERP